MRPITPPQSPANASDINESFDYSQKEDAPGDKKMEEIIPQAAPAVNHDDIQADDRNIHPITLPPPPINFTDVREPLNLLNE